MAALAYPVGGTRIRRRAGAVTPQPYVDTSSQRPARNLRVVSTTSALQHGAPAKRTPSVDDASATIHLLKRQQISPAQRVRSRVGLSPRRVEAYAPITPLRRFEEFELVRPIPLPTRPEDPAIEQEREIARRVAAKRRARIARLRRRRLLALSSAVATLASFVGLWLGAGALSAMHSPTLQVLPGSVKTTGGYLYTVQAGDTIWSVASRLTPSGDPRPIVDQLAAEVGGTALQPGTQLLVP